MKWFVTQLFKVIATILNGAFGMLGGLMDDLELDIGTSKSFLASVFPKVNAFGSAIMVLGCSLVVIIMVWELFKAMGGPYVDSAQAPGTTIARTFLAGGATINAYYFFRIIEGLFNDTFSAFKSIYAESVPKNFTLIRALKTPGGKSITPWEELSSTVQGQYRITWGSNAQKMYYQTMGVDKSQISGIWGSDDLIKAGGQWNADNIALLLVEIFVGILILILFVKLIIEVYERYVVLGVLYMFSPLAMSTLILQKGTIAKSYVRMIFSEIIVMCSSIFFVGVFLASWNDKINGKTPIFDSPSQFIGTMICYAAWLQTGMKFDEMLKGLGLSTVTTGGGILDAAVGAWGAVKTTGAILKAPGAALAGGAKTISGAKKGINNSIAQNKERMQKRADGQARAEEQNKAMQNREAATNSVNQMFKKHNSGENSATGKNANTIAEEFGLGKVKQETAQGKILSNAGIDVERVNNEGWDRVTNNENGSITLEKDNTGITVTPGVYKDNTPNTYHADGIGYKVDADAHENFQNRMNNNIDSIISQKPNTKKDNE